MACGCSKKKSSLPKSPVEIIETQPTQTPAPVYIAPTKRYEVVKGGSVLAEYDTLSEASDFARENSAGVRQTILNQ